MTTIFIIVSFFALFNHIKAYLTNIINKPLLVTGNLVALDEDKPIKYWLRKLNDNRQPSLFVKFDVEQYTDGMPCLGVSKYKWNQLQ